jgi:predicted nucleotidyltransferase
MNEYSIIMANLSERIEDIKASILKFVPARYIYLFGSYAYGIPSDKSDIDIYIVIPDEISNLTEIYAKIVVDLSYKKIYFIDLFLNNENIFNRRKIENIFEKTVYQKGKVLYEH